LKDLKAKFETIMDGINQQTTAFEVECAVGVGSDYVEI